MAQDKVELNPQLLRKSEIFSALHDIQLQRIIDAPENGVRNFNPHQLILREGDVGDCMYVILEGAVEVLISSGSWDKREAPIATLYAGDFFGETAVLSENPTQRTASVRAAFPSKVFRIDKKYVLDALAAGAKAKGRFPPDEARDTIMKLRLFSALKHEELLNIRTWTEMVSYAPGQFVCKEGQPGNELYVILEGSVEIFTLNRDGDIAPINTLSQRGDYFGELALMPESSGKRNAFVRTLAHTRLIKVPKARFLELLKRDTELANNLKNTCQIQNAKIRELKKSA